MNEMCVSFVYFYPAHAISTCTSLPPLYQSVQVVESFGDRVSNHFYFSRVNSSQLANTQNQNLFWFNIKHIISTLDFKKDKRPVYEYVLFIEKHLTSDCALRRPHAEYPYFRITAPPEFVGMQPREVFQALDWTNQTLRNRYQDLILEQNAHMKLVCRISSLVSVIFLWVC